MPIRERLSLIWYRRRVVQDEAFEALGELADVEVYQKSDGATGQFKITHQLGFVQRGDLLDCLQSDDNQPFDEQIEAIPAIETLPAINHGQRSLPLDAQTTLAKLEG